MSTVSTVSTLPTVTAMAAMAAVTTNVHPYKSDEDQQPKPVCGEPCHELFLQ